MKISSDTELVINALEEYTDGNVRKKNDFAAILEIGATYQEPALINDVIFYGTAFWNVYSSLKKAPRDDEAFSNLEKQFKEMNESLRAKLIEITELADDNIKKRFNDIYLHPDQGAMLNLVDLAHDLAKFKGLQIAVKQKKK